MVARVLGALQVGAVFVVLTAFVLALTWLCDNAPSAYDIIAILAG